jgi:hypothetical protein
MPFHAKGILLSPQMRAVSRTKADADQLPAAVLRAYVQTIRWL